MKYIRNKMFRRNKMVADKPKRLSNHFKFGKTMLSLWGLWPNRTLSPVASILYKIYGIMILLVTIVPYNVCSTVDTILQLRTGVWMEMLPRFSVALAMMLGFVKVCVYLFHMKTVEKYMEVYDDEIFVYKTSKYLNSNAIVERCVRLYNAQVSVCFGIIGILVMTDVDTILGDPKSSSIPELPFVNWLPYDYSKSPIYEISFFLTNFWFFISANIIIVFDTILMGLMIHTAGQLQILRLALETLRSRAVEEVDEANYGRFLKVEKLNEKIEEMFKKCAKHHQAIIRNTTGFERIFSTMIFLQFITSCLMVCFTILIVTSNDSAMSSRMTCLIILACSMWELTVYCYFGNQIILESNFLSRSIYLSEWYLMDKNIKLNFSIMMTRAQKPIIFKAGRFVPLSLYTLLKVLKAAYSYYTFLRNIVAE